MTIFNCSTHGEWDSNRASGCPDCTMQMRHEIRQLRLVHNRLLTLATKHCPKKHRDFDEILKIANTESNLMKTKKSPCVCCSNDEYYPLSIYSYQCTCGNKNRMDTAAQWCRSMNNKSEADADYGKSKTQ